QRRAVMQQREIDIIHSMQDRIAALHGVLSALLCTLDEQKQIDHDVLNRQIEEHVQQLKDDGETSGAAALADLHADLSDNLLMQEVVRRRQRRAAANPPPERQEQVD